MRHAFLNARTFASLRRHRNYRLYFVGQVDLAERHLDAEHRARLAGRRADAFACRGRPARVPALRPVRGLLAAGRRPRRSLRQPQDDDGHAGGVDGDLRRARPSCAQRETELWMVYVLALLGGTAAVFDAPNRHALTFQLVGRDELPNAVALNASLFNASRVVGPAIGGVVIAAAGVGACFAVNAVSFLAVLAALALMRTRELFPLERRERPELLKGMRHGLGYVWRTPSDPARPADDDGRLDRWVQLPRARAGARVEDAARRCGGVRRARRVLRSRRARRRPVRGDLRQGELEGARARIGRVQHDAARARARLLGVAGRGAPLPDRRLLHHLDGEQPVDHPADRARSPARTRALDLPLRLRRVRARRRPARGLARRTSAGRSSPSSSPASRAWR